MRFILLVVVPFIAGCFGGGITVTFAMPDTTVQQRKMEQGWKGDQDEMKKWQKNMQDEGPITGLEWR